MLGLLERGNIEDILKVYGNSRFYCSINFEGSDCCDCIVVDFDGTFQLRFYSFGSHRYLLWLRCALERIMCVIFV